MFTLTRNYEYNQSQVHTRSLFHFDNKTLRIISKPQKSRNQNGKSRVIVGHRLCIESGRLTALPSSDSQLFDYRRGHMETMNLPDEDDSHK